MNYSKGEWRVYPDYRLQTFDILVNGDMKKRICRLENKEDEANAHLIAAAVNACQSVNSDTPLAVAESIKDMYEALQAISLLSPKSMLEDCCYQGIPPKKWVKETAPYYDGYNKLLSEVKNIIAKAVAKAEGKE